MRSLFMNKVTFPLEPPIQGIEVEDLQTALQASIGQVVVVLGDNEIARREIPAALQQQHPRKEYGSITVKLV
jgi:hypothetical protein